MLKRIFLCSAAVLFAAGLGMAAPKAKAKAATSEKWWGGYIMDKKCSPMGMKGATNLACIKKCVAAGSPLVLYDNATKKVYDLDPQSVAVEHEAHHVRVYGTLEAGTIHVTTIKMYPMHHAAKAASKPMN